MEAILELVSLNELAALVIAAPDDERWVVPQPANDLTGFCLDRGQKLRVGWI